MAWYRHVRTLHVSLLYIVFGSAQTLCSIVIANSKEESEQTSSKSNNPDQFNFQIINVDEIRHWFAVDPRLLNPPEQALDHAMSLNTVICGAMFRRFSTQNGVSKYCDLWLCFDDFLRTIIQFLLLCIVCIYILLYTCRVFSIPNASGT